MEVFSIFGKPGVRAWLAMILVHLLELILVIALLASPKWVELEDSEENIKFTGGLLKVTSGNFSDEYYSDLRDEWCDLKLEQERFDLSYYYYEAGCEHFANLDIGAEIMLGMEITVILLEVTTIFVYLISYKVENYFWTVILLNFLDFLFHLTCFNVYVHSLHINFDKDCDLWYKIAYVGPLCASASLEIFVYVIIQSGIVFFADFLIVIQFYKRRRYR